MRSINEILFTPKDVDVVLIQLIWYNTVNHKRGII